MNTYYLSVDSTTPLTEEQKEKYAIVSTSLTYTVDGIEQKDEFANEAEISTFYEKLRKGHKAQSAKVAPQAFINTWRPLLEAGKKILHLSLSSKVSGTYESACIAEEELRKDFPESIEVVDTKIGSFCNAKMAMEASDLQKKGWSIERVIEWVKKEAEKFNLIFTVDDIGHLHRGGRIGHVSAIIGSVLKLKPVLYVSEAGKLEHVNNARGVKKAMADIIGKIKKNTTEETVWAYIAHGGDETKALMLKEKILGAFETIKQVDIGVLSPVLGLHAGPGSIVVAFKGKQRDMIFNV